MKAKSKAWIGPLAGAVLFCAAIWILHRELAAHHLKDILQQIRILPAGRIAVSAIGCTHPGGCRPWRLPRSSFSVP